MVAINKNETKLIRKFFPYVHVRRTVHKYYMEENKKAIEFLKSCDITRG